MKYLSTRGQSRPRSFSQAVVEGLSRDGGLLVPETYPDVSARLDEFSVMSYQELAFEIFAPYIEGEYSNDVLRALIKKSYSGFAKSDVTPLRVTENVCILELFHGPTLAFKDIALQFLGNMFETSLKEKNASLNIIGATSGDTGSAAIQGVRGKKNISIFMLHPRGKISPIQEKQMTTVLDENVINIAVDGTFDDAQRIVKELFNDLEFRDKYCLAAVNSINWARVMAQIVYYFYAAFRFFESYPGEPLVFSVPTGNFGDIYAGYVAKKMGLPIEKLILATNENDILYQVLNTGIYQTKDVVSTISPSMDIQISSNFERYLFDLEDRDADKVNELMTELSASGKFRIDETKLSMARETFLPFRVNTKQTLETIKSYYSKGIEIDPHTAVGVYAAEHSEYSNVICLATAHPAKFEEAFIMATGQKSDIPESLRGIMDKESRCVTSTNKASDVKQILQEKLADLG